MIPPYIETYTGLNYYFLDPQPDQIEIRDIAMALANKCRFSGHTRFFSIAEHSVTVAQRMGDELGMYGLLHDAAEAYLGDIPSPIKQYLHDYKTLETINEAAISKKFGLEWDIFKQGKMKHADLEALKVEAWYLIPSRGADWPMLQDPALKFETGYAPQCWSPQEAYDNFMAQYDLLQSRRIKRKDCQTVGCN